MPAFWRKRLGINCLGLFQENALEPVTAPVQPSAMTQRSPFRYAEPLISVRTERRTDLRFGRAHDENVVFASSKC